MTTPDDEFKLHDDNIEHVDPQRVKELTQVAIDYCQTFEEILRKNGKTPTETAFITYRAVSALLGASYIMLSSDNLNVAGTFLRLTINRCLQDVEAFMREKYSKNIQFGFAFTAKEVKEDENNPSEE